MNFSLGKISKIEHYAEPPYYFVPFWCRNYQRMKDILSPKTNQHSRKNCLSKMRAGRKLSFAEVWSTFFPANDRDDLPP